MAVIVPNEIIKQQQLQENDKVVINVIKKVDLTSIFGMIKEKDRKMSAQEAKNLARKGWKN